MSPGARSVATARSGGACELCGLEWPWLLYVFLVDEAAAASATNLLVLCAACSKGRRGTFAPLLTQPSLRDRLRDRNNRRTGAARLTASRRRRLIEARGGRCEVCGVAASVRQLHVHHRLGVFRGGDDAEENLMVLCFACHHHLRPCAAGCGGWAKKPSELCRRCATACRLAELRAAEGGSAGREGGREIRQAPERPAALEREEAVALQTQLDRAR